MTNQCQGCQKGWKKETHKPWPKGSMTMDFHIVEGGYAGEKVVCTRRDYRNAQQPTNRIN